MTRFARARGSKSSNERLPEEATSWQEMKQQLKEKQNPEKNSSGENIRQKLSKFEFKSVEKSEWAEFEKPNLKQANEKKIKKKSKTKTLLEQDENSTALMGNDNIHGSNLHKLSQLNTKVKKKSKKLPKKIKKVFEKVPMKDILTASGKVEVDEVKKKKKKARNIIQNISDNEDKKKFVNENIRSDSENYVEQTKIKKEKTRDSNIRDHCKKQKNYYKLSRDSNKRHMKNNKFRTRKQKGLPYKRRKTEAIPEKMFINGKEIEVVKFDGFPVKKEDAEHLAELRKNMVKKGISKEEISAAMKLERRKAEKALARERKKVCFHCRKAGHVLSECPELGDSNETGTGICFKCGSTEHTHFECKVIRGQDFRYAECFICKEQGHIARQCPDNPRGLYPKGGACKVCGDVTHLKKDCPDLIAKKENETITLQTLNNNSLEVLDEDISKMKHKTPEGKTLKKKAIVKF